MIIMVMFTGDERECVPSFSRAFPVVYSIPIPDTRLSLVLIPSPIPIPIGYSHFSAPIPALPALSHLITNDQ